MNGKFRRDHTRESGITLIEILIVIVVTAILASAAVPVFGDWSRNQRLATAARGLESVLHAARAEAMKTGRNHLVYFRIDGVSTQDAAGNDIENVNGDAATAVVAMDLFAANENCALDSGDQRTSLTDYSEDFSWGVTMASGRAPLDTNLPAIGSGSTFARAAAPTSPVNGILFRPNGTPVTFSADGSGCLTIDTMGSGGGALYLTNGRRDYAIVQAPLGGTRLHVWRPDAGAWSP